MNDSNSAKTTEVAVWDLPTRLFHWCLVVLVACLIITGNRGGNAMQWHGYFGYATLTLLLFRLIWGFVGGHYSRFASFAPTPKRVMDYVRGTAPKALGHNPLGALSVFALLLLLLLQTVSGLFADDEIAYSGPLSSLVPNAWVAIASKWHKGIGQPLLYVMIALHISAILFYLFRKNDNLIEPMITGIKEAELAPVNISGSTQSNAKMMLLALVIVLLCAGIVAWVVSLGK